mmetsp:Transcript_39262/g.54848  ORF Transcript_39262/g.54848 Transcript_39262/m.54848 type:complete len:234 (+) Transcript_39262:131-832(+)
MLAFECDIDFSIQLAFPIAPTAKATRSTSSAFEPFVGHAWDCSQLASNPLLCFRSQAQSSAAPSGLFRSECAVVSKSLHCLADTLAGVLLAESALPLQGDVKTSLTVGAAAAGPRSGTVMVAHFDWPASLAAATYTQAADCWKKAGIFTRSSSARTQLVSSSRDTYLLSSSLYSGSSTVMVSGWPNEGSKAATKYLRIGDDVAVGDCQLIRIRRRPGAAQSTADVSRTGAAGG